MFVGWGNKRMEWESWKRLHVWVLQVKGWWRVYLFNHLRCSVRFSLWSPEVFRKNHSDKNLRLICPVAVNPRGERRLKWPLSHRKWIFYSTLLISWASGHGTLRNSGADAHSHLSWRICKSCREVLSTHGCVNILSQPRVQVVMLVLGPVCFSQLCLPEQP